MNTCHNYKPSGNNYCINCYGSLVDHVIENNLDLDELELFSTCKYNYFSINNTSKYF